MAVAAMRRRTWDSVDVRVGRVVNFRDVGGLVRS